MNESSEMLAIIFVICLKHMFRHCAQVAVGFDILSKKCNILHVLLFIINHNLSTRN